jgi:HlyD family secretion protein
MTLRTLTLLGLLLALAACGKTDKEATAKRSYETATVARKTLEISVEAAGVIEPIRTVELKSKASGEILEMAAETGDAVQRGQLLVRIDQRTPRNRVAQAQSALAAAQAKLINARSQLERGRKLVSEKWINPADYDKLQLEVATAEAEVVTQRVALENARIALDDTQVRAPASGTILTRRVEPGQVISSPTMDVGGGSLLLTMADLTQVRVRTRVDETDIGKIAPGLAAEVTVASFPGRHFHGTVEKIEPQAVVEQNVTLFPVLITLDNADGLLRPGMNVDAQFNVARRENAIVIPVTALRTPRDVATTASLLGIEEGAIRAVVEQERGATRSPGTTSGESAGPKRNEGERARAGNATAGGMQAAGGAGAGSGESASQRSGAGRFGGVQWVVRQKGSALEPVAVKTGLTDLDLVEVLSGLQEGDQVLLLPSSGLVENQERMRGYMNSRGGIPGMNQRSGDSAGGQPGTTGRRPSGN